MPRHARRGRRGPDFWFWVAIGVTCALAVLLIYTSKWGG